ncbi:MAG: hypothetical protein AB4372_28455 [Xenococcus sp. (in: cyanobacteria)]
MKYYLFILLLGLSVQFASAQDQENQKSNESGRTNTYLEKTSAKNALYSYTSFIASTRENTIQSQLDFQLNELVAISPRQAPDQLDPRKNWSRWTFIANASK